MTIFTDNAARGRTAWWRYPLVVVLSLLAWIAAMAVVAIGLLVLGLPPATLSRDLMSPVQPLAFYLANGVLFGVILLAFIGFIRLIHAKGFGDVVGPWRWRLVLIGAGLWFAVETLGALADLMFAPHAFRLTLSRDTGVLALSAFVGLGAQTFAEEYVFRGYLTQALWLAVRRPWVAAVLSGLLFGALHIPNGWPQAANAVVFGVATAVLAMRTGGIAFTFGLHLCNNLFGAVVVVSGSDVFKGSPGLFTETAPQLAGLDVALVAVALLALLWLTGERSPFAAQFTRPNAAAS
jgi:membrane protease YdiL (CAAX protease family)